MIKTRQKTNVRHHLGGTRREASVLQMCRKAVRRPRHSDVVRDGCEAGPQKQQRNRPLDTEPALKKQHPPHSVASVWPGPWRGRGRDEWPTPTGGELPPPSADSHWGWRGCGCYEVNWGFSWLVAVREQIGVVMWTLAD